MAAITHYTTSDLDYYYADLKRLPRLTREERQQLLVQASQGERMVLNRLIEDHLSLATRIAIDRCPRRGYRGFDDVIGDVCLTLVKVAHRYDFTAPGDFTAYVIACTEGATKRSIGDDRLIHVPSSTYSRYKQEERLAELYQ